MDTVFSASFLLVLPFWLLMIVLPTWRFTERIMRSPWIAAPAGVLYAVLVLPRLLEVLGAVTNPNLAGVSALLGSPAGATIGWAQTAINAVVMALGFVIGGYVFYGLDRWMSRRTVAATP